MPIDGTIASAITAAVDEQRVVELLGGLIAVPSLSGQEDAGQEHVAALLAAIGLDVDRWTIDMEQLSEDRWYSAEVQRGTALGVAGTLGAGDGPSLLLNGHVDVVPVGTGSDWTTPPFEPDVRDGRVYGRGACDMKGGLAAALHALEVLADLDVPLAGSVTLASVVGEEDGGCGTLALLGHGVRADSCVIMEPTELSVVPAVAGALSWRIRIRGRSAHGCLRGEGVSAIEAFFGVHRAVLDLEARRNARTPDPLFAWLDRPYAICGGRIAGGDWPSSEADWLVWEGRYGVAPGEDLAVARREFEEAVAVAAATDPWLSSHPPTVEWWGGQFLPGRTPVDADVVTAVRSAAERVMGVEPVVRGMPYGCDLGLTTNVGGIPTVVFGPGDVRDAHRPDESVPIVDLGVVARSLALTAVDLCGLR